MDKTQPFFTLSLEQAEPIFKNWVKNCLTEMKPDNPVNSFPKYHSRREVSEILKLSLPTIDRYVELGLLRCSRIGNRILFSEDDIQAALKEIPQRYTRK